MFRNIWLRIEFSRDNGINWRSTSANTLKKDFPIASQDAGIASDRWQYVIDYQESMSVSEIIEQLVDLFQTTPLQILNIKKKFNAKCLIIVSTQAHETWMPCMTLSERCIDFAHQISSPIDFDIYCYSD